MQEALNGRQTDFVFNLDEVGISEWKDRKSKEVVVLVGMRVKLSTIEYLGIWRRPVSGSDGA
jgi:hypothetical protein